MMAQFAIELTPDEQALLTAITFHAPREPAAYKRNGEIVLRLTQSLFSRNAIPEHRLRYFTDPEYNVSNSRQSRQEVFEHNGCSDEKILRHGHFLPYLRYFISGADLPDAVRNAFRVAVEECGDVTSGDIAPLASKARALARQCGRKGDAREEFYKLALDCGLSQADAASIRSAVMQLR